MTKLAATSTTTQRRIERWQEKFLDSLRAVCNVTTACAAAGISRQQAYRTRESDAAFAEAWQSALDAAVDELEATAFKRSLEEGESQLLMFMLRCHKPSVYKETSRHEVGLGLVGGVIFLPQKTEGAE